MSLRRRKESQVTEITLHGEESGRAKWRELVQAAQAGGGGYMVIADAEGDLHGIPLGLTPRAVG